MLSDSLNDASPLQTLQNCNVLLSQGAVSGFDSKGVEGAIAAEFHGLRKAETTQSVA